MPGVIQSAGLNMWLVVLVAAGIAGFIYLLWRIRQNDLLWTDLWVRIWKMGRWKRQTSGLERRESWEREGMPAPERELYSTYKKHIPDVSRHIFDNGREFLETTHQIGRAPTPFSIWLLLFTLTVAEAAGTGLLIAPWVASQSTGNQLVWIGYAIALVMAVVLLLMTHASGGAVYKYVSIRRNIGPYTRTATGYLQQVISSGSDNSLDRDQDKKIRFANRVLEGDHDRGSIALPVITCLFLVVLLLGITWIRVRGIEVELAQNQVDQSTLSSGGSDPFANIPGYAQPASPTAPQVDGQPAAAPDNTGSLQARLQHEKLSQGLAGAIVLAIIYLITQMVGFIQSFGHSFMKDGRAAYYLTMGEPRFDTFQSKYVTPILVRADMRLSELRAHLMRRVEQYGRDPASLTCRDCYTRDLAAAESSLFHTPARLPQPQSATETDDDIARNILAAPDPATRARLLDDAAGGLSTREDAILQAMRKLKLAQDARAKFRDEMLGDR